MAYPYYWAAGRDPATQDVPVVEETLPMDANGNVSYSSRPMLHFDLDVRNGECQNMGANWKLQNNLSAVVKSNI